MSKPWPEKGTHSTYKAWPEEKQETI
jgi:hypothetical protein